MIKRIKLLFEAMERVFLANPKEPSIHLVEENIKKCFTENILIFDPKFYKRLKESRRKGFSKNISKFFIIAELINNKMSYEDLKWAYKNVLGIKKKGRLDQHLTELIKDGLIVSENCAEWEKDITQCTFLLPHQDFEYFKTVLDKLVYNSSSLKEFEELILSQLIFEEELYKNLLKCIEEKILKIGMKKRRFRENYYYSQVDWLAKLIFLYICKKLYYVGVVGLEKIKPEYYLLSKKDFTLVDKEFAERRKFLEKIIRKSRVSKRLKHKFKALVELMESLEKFLNKLDTKEKIEYFLNSWFLFMKIYALNSSYFWKNPLFLYFLLFYVTNDWYFRDERDQKHSSF